MNEQIYKIARQADALAREIVPDLREIVSYNRIRDEKFAELIVRECIQVGGPEDSYTDEWFEAKVDSVQKIQKHFGVEE